MIHNISFNLIGNFQELEATPEIISRLLTEFLRNDLSVMPGTFQQVNPGLGMKMFERMQFTNPKNNLTILINVDSIQISTILYKAKSYNLNKNIVEFITTINKFFKSIDSIGIDIPGSRVALIVGILYDSNKLKPLEDIYELFGGRIPLYNSKETFEWNARAVRNDLIRTTQGDEKLNIVSEVARTQGETNNAGFETSFDTINVVIDINTVFEKKNERVNSDFVKEFLENTRDKMVNQHNEIEVLLNGAS